MVRKTRVDDDRIYLLFLLCLWVWLIKFSPACLLVSPVLSGGRRLSGRSCFILTSLLIRDYLSQRVRAPASLWRATSVRGQYILTRNPHHHLSTVARPLLLFRSARP